MKNPNCYMPACGIEGKLCPDCANYRPPKYELYFAVKDFFLGNTTYKSNEAWFTKHNGSFELYNQTSVEMPEDWFRKCKNPVFPSRHTLAFRLETEYPGSQPRNTLFTMSKEKEYLLVYFWRGGWRQSSLKNVDLRQWSNHFTQIKHLTIVE